MSSLPPQPREWEESDDGGCQGSQPGKRLRCSSCRDDKQMELLEKMWNMLQKQDQKIESMFQEKQNQNQKIESMFQENQCLREKVSSLTADINRLDGYLQQSPAPRVLISDQHCSIPLRLRFLNSCKNDKYSKRKIEADDETPLKVAIYNLKNEVITSEPFSSMRVHIVPIQGDFDNDRQGQWTEEHFRNKIVSGRPGKEPLLLGDLYIRLQDGVGYLNTAIFQDNSSFVASKRFKLGVMAADTRISQRIQEGITESFAVKDNRGYKKKKILYPSPQDPVHKLKKIAPGGDRHKLLEKKGIKTVEDFVLSYNQSPEDLRKILGKISDQDWHTVIDNAQKCNSRPGNQEHLVISSSDGSPYIEGSSLMQLLNRAPPIQPRFQGMHQQSSSAYTELSSGVPSEDFQGMHQQSSSTYTDELSSGVPLEDAPREQVGIQVDEDQISGAGNEALSVSVPLIDNNNNNISRNETLLEGLAQQVHSGYFPTADDDPLENLCKHILTNVPATEDSRRGDYRSVLQSGGYTPSSGAGTPASEAGSCGSLMHHSRSPVRGARGQVFPTLSSSPAGGASSSTYRTARADNSDYADEEDFFRKIMDEEDLDWEMLLQDSSSRQQ